MKKQFIVVAGSGFALFLASCGGGGGSGIDGRQIDAMGRPAINTALVNTFAPDAERGHSEDEFNSTGNASRGQFAGTMADQLAVYDSLAGSCGDNPLTNRASADPADGLASGAARYDFIATVFADDQLYVNASTGGSEGGQCTQYLAAELGVIGVPGLGADCGGRTPLYDVIQTTYSAVAVGGVSGVDDGVAADNITQSATAFPFLAAPQS